MAEKVPTIMALRVDLKCYRCFKKVKKVLCKFPEIRDQQYDEKQNTVTIKVFSCCPEKVKQKIFCKGGKSIKSIEIKPRSKPTDSKPPEKTGPPNPSQQPTKPPKDPKPGPPQPPPVLGLPPVLPICVCIKPCYLCPPGGKCWHPPPPPCSGSCRKPGNDSCGCGCRCGRDCRRGCGCGCGGHRPCYSSFCDYFSQENTSGCSMM